MAHSLVIVLALAVFQPVYTKSLQSNTRVETLQPDGSGRKVVSAAPVGLTYPDAALKLKLPEIEPCPDGQDYCDTADDYPTNQIKENIKKQPKFILDQFYVEVDDSETNKFIPSRAVETPLCLSQIVTLYPKKAKSKDGSYEFVVNDEENKQGVRVERCASGSNSQQCSIPGSLPYGYASLCEQKYIQRALVVVDRNSPEHSGFITKPFDFPACCSCKVYMTGETDRFGAIVANTSSAVPT